MNLDALVSKVGDQLTAVVRKQITENITLVTGLEKEVKNISTNLRKIQQVLDDAETRQTKDINIKEWLEKLEDFSYEIEDVVDEWNTEIHRQQLEADDHFEKCCCCCLTCFLSYVLCFNLVKRRHDIAAKIKKLNEKLELIVKEKDKYNFLPSVKVRSKEWKRTESTWFIDESVIVGREKAQKDLVGKLCSNSQYRNPVPIIKITGTGGIGKTTLAQVAFNNDQVKAKFRIRIWVCVGESFYGIKIANQIRKSLNSDSKNESDFQIALDNIQTSISNREVLLVLDDVWKVNEGDWAKLRNCLSHVASGSKIVVTTRSDDVAKTLGATDEVFVKLLGDWDCWDVIRKIALSGKSKYYGEQWEIIGNEIAKKCKGLPLAATALGSLLRFRETKKEWEEVQNSQLWELEGVVGDVFPHLQLSYNDLSSAIKRCFVYCAIFPKDDEIDVERLITMWIAQGYVKTKKRGDKTEQVGLEYFKVLASHAFFQEVRKESNGILTCKMHDIVHDFAQYLAKDECVTIGDAADADSCKNARHLAITCKDVDAGSLTSFLLSVYQTGNTRSIFIYTRGMNERILRLFCHLKHLRILKIIDEYVKQLPNEIGNLIHLRVLDVVNSSLEKLPDQICDLYNLQALYCGAYIRMLPPKIGQLMNLRTLHVESALYDILEQIPRSIEMLTRLQHLPTYGVRKNSNKLSYLRNLNQLRGHMIVRFIEGMSEESDVEEAKMAEFEKKKIDSLLLSLFGTNVRREVIEALKPHKDLSELVLSGYQQVRLPIWITELSGLRHLSLLLCRNLKYLPPLWKFPFLETLRISHSSRLTRLSVGDFLELDRTDDQKCTSFPNLKTLELISCTELEKWEDIGDGIKENTAAAVQLEVHLSAIIMPRLQQLRVNNAKKLKGLPYNLLRKATELHSIEFNDIEYGPITSLSPNQPPFLPQPFLNRHGDGMSDLEQRVQTTKQDMPEPSQLECKVVVKKDRSGGDTRNGPATQSPHIDQVPEKKQKAAEEDHSVSAVPKPVDPFTDFDYDPSKYSLLLSWIEKNENRSKEIGLVPIIQQYDAISAYNLHEICFNGWLSNEDTDAILQLFNLQGEKYPEIFPSRRWTCLGSLYNVAVRSGFTMFTENRQMEKEAGTVSKNVPWQNINMDLYKFVMGINKNWESEFWYKCDYVYGIESIAGVHWAAYSYDLKNRVVNVYDSMLNSMKDERMEVFNKHAVIAPSLYNLHFDKSDDMLDPNIPFDIKIVKVPQQPNSYDCGVYACKFIQCLAMQEEFSKLLAERFSDYRKKLAIDLIKWTETSIGKFSFHELQIKTAT